MSEYVLNAKRNTYKYLNNFCNLCRIDPVQPIFTDKQIVLIPWSSLLQGGGRGITWISEQAENKLEWKGPRDTQRRPAGQKEGFGGVSYGETGPGGRHRTKSMLLRTKLTRYTRTAGFPRWWPTPLALCLASSASFAWLWHLWQWGPLCLSWPLGLGWS